MEQSLKEEVCTIDDIALFVDEIISKNISINYLYNNIVGISNIEIKLYKIEETRQSEINWNNVSTNSGGDSIYYMNYILQDLK